MPTQEQNSLLIKRSLTSFKKILLKQTSFVLKHLKIIASWSELQMRKNKNGKKKLRRSDLKISEFLMKSNCGSRRIQTSLILLSRIMKSQQGTLGINSKMSLICSLRSSPSLKSSMIRFKKSTESNQQI